MRANLTDDTDAETPDAPRRKRAGRLVVPMILVAMAVVPYLIADRSDNQPRGVQSPSQRKPMPPLTLTDRDGKIWRSADQTGKIVLINYGATWCPPCRRETPGLVRLATEWAPRGLVVVGVAMDFGDDRAVADFVREYRIPYPILRPSRATLPGDALVLPTTILLDRSGRIAKTYVGAVNQSTFEADLRTLLHEPHRAP